MGDDGSGGFGANENDNGGTSSGIGGFGDSTGLGGDSTGFDSGLGFDGFGAGIGFGLSDAPTTSNDGTFGYGVDSQAMNEDEGIMGKIGKAISNMALSQVASQLGIPGFAIGLGKAGLNAAQAPTQEAQTDAVGKGVMGTIAGMMGFGVPMGLANMGLNAMSNAGMIGQANTNADGTPAPAGTTGGASVGTNGIGGMEGILGGLASLYGYNRANNSINDQVNSLSGMFGQDSAYSQMLRQQLQRKDAAGGRRSQYGPREVELQARLADLASRNAPQIGALRQGQNQMRAQGLAQLLQFMNKSGTTNAIGNGLQGLYNSGISSGVSNGWLPSNDVGTTDTPFPDLGYGG